MCDLCYQHAAILCPCGLVLCYGCYGKHAHSDTPQTAQPESEYFPTAGKIPSQGGLPLMLSDPMRGTLHIIRAASKMTYHDGGFYAGDVQINSDTARALIRHHYVALDAERNADADTTGFWHYRLTGKDVEESEAE